MVAAYEVQEYEFELISSISAYRIKPFSTASFDGPGATIRWSPFSTTEINSEG